ncbi:unnamed protein product, partial [Ilex paraguariensis]
KQEKLGHVTWGQVCSTSEVNLIQKEKSSGLSRPKALSKQGDIREGTSRNEILPRKE